MQAMNGQKPRQIAIKSGKGAGKTALLCVIDYWRVWRAKNAFGIHTAPIQRQCVTIFLAEMGRILANANPILINATKVRRTFVQMYTNPDWRIQTLTGAKKENLQGYHQDNLTASGDEASGLPDDAFEAFESTLTNEDSLLVWISNPTRVTGGFAECFRAKKSQYQNYTFNCKEISDRHPELIDPKRIAQTIEQYGENSNYVRVNVYGEFPHADPDAILGADEAWAAAAMNELPQHQMHAMQRSIGVDFARMGADDSAVYFREGNRIIKHRVFNHVDPTDVLEWCSQVVLALGWNDRSDIEDPSRPPCVYVFDAGGLGQSAFPWLAKNRKRYYGCYNNNKASSLAFADLISEAYFMLRDRVRAMTAGFPADPIAVNQLTSRNYHMTSRNQIKIESKEEYKTRLKCSQSPDRADGIVYAYYENGVITQLGRPRNVRAYELAAQEHQDLRDIARQRVQEPPKAAPNHTPPNRWGVGL